MNERTKAEWAELERQTEERMIKEGLTWCPSCDGTGCHPDDDRAVRGDACPTCQGTSTVALERVKVAELQ